MDKYWFDEIFFYKKKSDTASAISDFLQNIENL
jgi:hypothetical protein